jgi:type IV pilus assembly protein PilC
MGTLSEAGLSYSLSLNEFQAETQNEYFKYIVNSLKAGIESGITLAEGMNGFPKVFSREFVHLVQAGEQTGTMSNSFRELRRYLEWLERLGGDIRQATTYPAFIAVTLCIFVLYLFSSVIPKITAILIDMKLKLPLITRLIVGLSEFALHTWYIWIAAFIATPLALRIGVRLNGRFACFIDKCKLGIPVFGNLLRLILQARFTQNFSIMHRAGVSIIENLELCRGFIGNRVYASSLSRALRNIQEGITLSDSLKKSGLFSGLVVRMFAVGEASGDLENTLMHAAAYYEEEVPRRIKQVFGILEPLIILLLVAVIGMVALAIFLPILSISQGISQ